MRITSAHVNRESGQIVHFVLISKWVGSSVADELNVPSNILSAHLVCKAHNLQLKKRLPSMEENACHGGLIS